MIFPFLPNHALAAWHEAPDGIDLKTGGLGDDEIRAMASTPRQVGEEGHRAMAHGRGGKDLRRIAKMSFNDRIEEIGD